MDGGLRVGPQAPARCLRAGQHLCTALPVSPHMDHTVPKIELHRLHLLELQVSKSIKAVHAMPLCEHFSALSIRANFLSSLLTTNSVVCCILRSEATSQSQGKKRNPNEFHDITYLLDHFVKKLVSIFTQVYRPCCNKGDNGKLVKLLYFVPHKRVSCDPFAGSVVIPYPQASSNREAGTRPSHFADGACGRRQLRRWRCYETGLRRPCHHRRHFHPRELLFLAAPNRRSHRFSSRSSPAPMSASGRSLTTFHSHHGGWRCPRCWFGRRPPRSF